MKSERTAMPTTAVPTKVDQFGQRIGARLNANSEKLDHGITERLRFAREQAVALLAAQPGLVSVGKRQSTVLSLGGGSAGNWGKFSILLPTVVLVVGLFCIDSAQDQYRAEELADVDVALLTSELPPLAYTDPGFIQFLQSTIRD